MKRTLELFRYFTCLIHNSPIDSFLSGQVNICLLDYLDAVYQKF